MAIKQSQRGFALLIAVIFMTVMLSFGLTLGALGYKQTILAATTVESQYAFYAADAALECALYFDQQTSPVPFPARNGLGYPSGVTKIACAGFPTTDIRPERVGNDGDTSAHVIYKIEKVDIGRFCADITVYAYNNALAGSRPYKKYIFAQGYSTSCGNVDGSGRYAARGIQAHY